MKINNKCEICFSCRRDDVPSPHSVIKPNFYAKKGKYYLFQTYDVTPSCGGILALKVVFDGISENFSLTLTVGTGVLQGADDNGFGAIAFVDAIDHFVKSFHLTDLLGGDIEEVLLDGSLGTDPHHDDTSPLILHPLNENPIQHLRSCLNNGNR